MRAERRQELRTNELSVQLEQFRKYLRANQPRILAVAAAIVVVLGAIVWYTRSRENKRMDGWRAFTAAARPLTEGGPQPDAATLIDRYAEIADQHITPPLTLAARLAIGDTARNRLINPPTGEAATGATRDWRTIATEAYESVVKDYPDHMAAAGDAMMALGALAEDEPNAEKARTWYERVKNDQRFRGTPFEEQAEARLKGLSEWMKPVEFPPPIVGPVADPNNPPPEVISETPTSAAQPPAAPPEPASPESSAPAGGPAASPTSQSS